MGTHVRIPIGGKYGGETMWRAAPRRPSAYERLSQPAPRLLLFFLSESPRRSNGCIGLGRFGAGGGVGSFFAMA
jgi:hypothetical protein